MVIDFKERCEALGITERAYLSAEKKLSTALGEYLVKGYDEIPFSDYPLIFEPDEIVALVRVYSFDKKFPEFFSHDGYIGQ